MKLELYWLLATLIMTALFWVPYVLNRIGELGLWPTLANPNMEIKPKSGWAVRMINAHKNAVENLVIFAPLILMVHIAGISSPVTVSAAMIYFLQCSLAYLSLK